MKKVSIRKLTRLDDDVKASTRDKKCDPRLL